MRNEVARKYSDALFSLGIEKDKLLECKEALDEFWQLTKENKEFREALFHQRIMPEVKKKIMEKIFADQLMPEIYNFICLLIERRRIYFLESIIKEFNRLVDAAESILDVTVISAVELDQATNAKLNDKLKEIFDFKIRTNNEVDPDIVGGLVLKVGDYIIDGSIRHHLAKLQEHIEAIPVSKLGVN